MAYYTVLVPEVTGQGLEGTNVQKLVSLLQSSRDESGEQRFGQVKIIHQQAGVFIEVLGDEPSKNNENTRVMNEIIKQFRA